MKNPALIFESLNLAVGRRAGTSFGTCAMVPAKVSAVVCSTHIVATSRRYPWLDGRREALGHLKTPRRPRHFPEQINSIPRSRDQHLHSWETKLLYEHLPRRATALSSVRNPMLHEHVVAPVDKALAVRSLLLTHLYCGVSLCPPAQRLSKIPCTYVLCRRRPPLFQVHCIPVSDG